MDRLREPGLRGAHLLAASGFALAQPLFDILGKNAEFFAVRGSTPADIVIFALVITFVPAAVLLAVELLVGLASERAGLALHYVFLGALFALFALQALKRIGFDSTVVLIGGGILVGIGIAAAVARLALARTFMTVLAAAPVVFLCVFLFDSSVTDLVFPGDTEVRVANVGPSAPVVFLLLDEFPVLSIMDENGEIDAGRYPNFARLAAGSTWFKNTTTLSASTTVAVPSMLTGQIPGRRKLPVFQRFPRNLFTMLGKDYRMNVPSRRRGSARRSSAPARARTRASACRASTPTRGSSTCICSRRRRSRIACRRSTSRGASSATRRPKSRATACRASRWSGRSGKEKAFYAGRIRQFETFVDLLSPPVEGQPTLDFLHVLLPHGPWLYFPDGRASAVAAANAPGRHGERWWDDGLANQAHQRHLLQLAYTDALLGDFLDNSRPPDSGTRRSCS